MPTVITEPVRMGEYIVSEASGYRSREAIIVASGADLPAGTVVAKVTASGKYVRLAPTASDGSQTAAGVIYGPALAAAADARVAAHVRDCEVNGNIIGWPAGITGPQQAAAIASLASIGVIVRS